MTNSWKDRISYFYMAVLLRITGRALQAACRTDPDLRLEFDRLPKNFTFILSVRPDGPFMTIRKSSENIVQYIPGNLGEAPHLHMQVKSPSLGFSLLTFRESTALCAARGRISVYGDVSHACAMVRVLDRVETYLLPRRTAMRAVKRYESPPAKHRRRAIIYLRTFFSP